jgi:hypothetical protein
MAISRRTFIERSAALAGTIGLCGTAWSDVLPALTGSDAMAQALGYRAEGARVDKAKYPAYEAGQACANCVLYQGVPGDASGPCPLYAGKSVSAKGWCSSYAKKG